MEYSVKQNKPKKLKKGKPYSIPSFPGLVTGQEKTYYNGKEVKHKTHRLDN